MCLLWCKASLLDILLTVSLSSEGSPGSGRFNVADPFAFPLETQDRQKRKRKTNAVAGNLPPVPLPVGVCGSTHLAASDSGAARGSTAASVAELAHRLALNVTPTAAGHTQAQLKFSQLPRIMLRFVKFGAAHFPFLRSDCLHVLVRYPETCGSSLSCEVPGCRSSIQARWSSVGW